MKATTWTTALLREVTTKIGTGATPRGGSHAYKATGIPLIRSLNVYDDGFREEGLAYLDDEQAARLDHVIVQEGDVLLNITGASIARCCTSPASLLPARVNQHVSIIRPRPEILCHRFLHYLLIAEACKKRLLDTGEEGGTTRQAITKAQLQNFQISFPPLPEQRRIVAVLDDTLKGVAATKRSMRQNLRNAEELFKSHLDDVVAECRGLGKASTLADLCDDSRIITYGVIKLGTHTPSGVPCLRTSNVRYLHIETKGMKCISQSLSSEYSRTILRGGEVLVNVRGTLGGVALVPSEMLGWNISREVAVVPVDPSRLSPEFLAYWIASNASQRWLGGVKKGAAYVGINIEDLRSLPVAVPPLEHQLKAVACLDSLRRNILSLETNTHRKEMALDELRASILSAALTASD